MSLVRTRQYTGGLVATDPVAIVAGAAAVTAGGQAALLSLCNAAVRNHPTVFVVAEDLPLLGASPGSIHGALEHLSGATESSTIEVVERPPTEMLSIGIGSDVTAGWYIGARRFTAVVSRSPTAMTDEPASAWGAGLAAMLAANLLFRAQIGLPLPEVVPLSLWDLAPALDEAASGPSDPGPVDVGDVWLVGAGGVGSSLAWWLAVLGLTGPWTVIDHDIVDDTNLNRSLGMVYSDFLHGRRKAAVAADLIGGTPFDGQWADWTDTDPAPPDVVIAAANDFGVRGALTSYSHPMTLTGTTSRNWTAELHLYRPEDGCPSCRHPEAAQASFACSQVSVPSAGGSRDAALSFLSGTAGLLAAAALCRLQAGALVGPMNHWTVHFEPTRRLVTSSRHSCEGSARHGLSDHVRTAVHGHTRWSD